MTIEKRILLSLLRCTKEGPASRQMLVKISKLPAEATEKTLSKFKRRSLFEEHCGIIEASPSQRVKIAIQALQLGADLQRACNLLSWAEFEEVAAQAIEANGYRAIRNFHFKYMTKKWEIDIIGIKTPLILCIDCKHWRHGWCRAANLKAVEAQIERTEAFAEAWPNYARRIKLEASHAATFVPLILSLLPGPEKLLDKVPIVPVPKLQDFINGLPFELDSLHHIDRIFTS